jgi:hypothetical protein
MRPSRMIVISSGPYPSDSASSVTVCDSSHASIYSTAVASGVGEA